MRRELCYTVEWYWQRRKAAVENDNHLCAAGSNENRKLAVRAFKSGPDYIDPMFHRQVIGVPSRNLDTFFQGQIRSGNCMDMTGRASLIR